MKLVGRFDLNITGLTHLYKLALLGNFKSWIVVSILLHGYLAIQTENITKESVYNYDKTYQSIAR